ncbi:MAG TPA: NUDIX hydrolase [Patescibacteria group bacterium]|jgi:8-oxo-dGTP pyrophosphatase MutT (NUDIX family)|nr:NUDIX hydrolase [Patescibacteria group bacterium]
MNKNTLFQYCQKLVILSDDKTKVLLAKRKGEADYDGTYSFIGGKMETTDESLLAGMKREKDEEIGSAAKIKVLPNETYNLIFRKQDGNSMILPHIAGIYVSGEIQLSDEYSDYKWVPISELETFEPKIENIPELTQWALQKLSSSTDDFVEI